MWVNENFDSFIVVDIMLKISVLILAKNEERYIGRCLDSVFLLELEKQWAELEVIVVDNDSDDSTHLIASSKGAKVITSSSNRIGDLRNVAASSSDGDFLAFVDADCTVPKFWLIDALKHFSSDKKIGAVGGHMNLPHDAGWVEKAWSLPSRDGIDKNVNLSGASMIIKRASFDDIGGFNCNLKTGEDMDLSRRLIKAGHKTVSDPKCNVIHYGYPATSAGFLDRQIWQVYGQFNPRKLVKDKSIFLSVVFGLSLIIGFLFLLFSVGYSYVMFGLSISIVLAFTGLKISRSSITVGFFDSIKIAWICFLYFTGRFLGVIFSVFRREYQRNYKT